MKSRAADLTPPPRSGYNKSVINLQIAIDGPAGAGKSTVARRVARALGLTYVDTGAMYRALAWAVLQNEIDPADTDTVTRLARSLDVKLQTTEDGTRVAVNGRDISDAIRTPEISNLTSPLSAIPGVRAEMAGRQARMGAAGGVVMEGRDIGTVVMPQAHVKVFLTASPERRAERRFLELTEKGLAPDRKTLLAEIQIRDNRDGSRDTAPMVPAPDAVILDTDGLSVDDVVERILALARARQEVLTGAQTV